LNYRLDETYIGDKKKQMHHLYSIYVEFDSSAASFSTCGYKKKSYHNKSLAMNRLSGLDGLRGVLHLSLVALHVCMMATAHVPAEGAVWIAISSSSLYSLFQLGGIQVDGFFMISGFLIVRKLLDDNSYKPLVHLHVLNRLLRLWPCVGFVLFVNIFILGDFEEVYQLRTFILNMLFVFNYAFESITLSLAILWSTCVDLQFGVVLAIVMDTVRRSDPANVLPNATKVFGFLLIVSLWIRYLNFHPEYGNLVRLGDLNHYGRTQTGGVFYELGLSETYKRKDLKNSYKYLADTYNHTWLIPKKEYFDDWVAISLYVRRIYMPTHTRFGPIVVGALVACFEKYLDANIGRFSTWKWPVVAWAISQLLLPCIPQGGSSADVIPMEAQIFITVALRTLSAFALGVLMLSSIVPRQSSWYIGFFDWLFNIPVLRAIGKLSFCSYLIHFRVIQELTFRYFKPSFDFTTGISQARTAFEIYICQLYALSLLISLLLSYLLHHLVELPGLKLQRLVMNQFPKSSIS